MHLPNLLADALSWTRQHQGSDLHFGTHTGLQARIGGNLTPFPIDQMPLSLGNETVYRDASRCHDGGASAVVSDLIDVVEELQANKDSLRNRSAKTRLEAVNKQLEAGHGLTDAVEDVIRLGELGTWRMMLYGSDLNGVGLALRALPASIPSLTDLVPDPLGDMVPRLEAAMARESGLFLVTGATGSGKSSTLAALVDVINTRRHKMILTLEAPVEFWHTPKCASIRHRQVGTDVPSFADGLKQALGQDPDVILIGELRDLETISLAMTAAETGHLVLATLHSRNVRSALTRMIDAFPPEQQAMIRTQLSDCLIGVMSQRLVSVETSGEDGTARRVLHPELAIFPHGQGGVRANIQDGRLNQVISALETMPKDNGGSYDSAERTQRLLAQAALISKSV